MIGALRRVASNAKRRLETAAFRRAFAVAIALSLVPAVVLAASLLAAIARRAQFPLDLEWLEGAELVQADRLLAGEPVYRAASDGFIPHPYPPVHYVLVWIAGLGHVGYASARWSSALAVVGLIAAVGAALRRHARERPLAAIAIGFVVGAVAAAYPATGAFYDIARNDAHAVALGLAPIVVLGGRRDARRAALAGVVAAIATYTKQTNVFFAAAAAIHLLPERRSLAIYAAAAVAPSLVALAVLHRISHGAFVPWMLGMAHHPIDRARAWHGLRAVVTFAPYALATPALCLVARARRALSPRAWSWTLAWACSFPASLLPFAKEGGFDNNLVPLFVATPIAFAFVALDVLRARPRSPLVVLGAAALATLYVVLRWFDAGAFVPSARAFEHARAWDEAVAALDGDVLCPHSPFLRYSGAPGAEPWPILSHVDAARAHVFGLTAETYGDAVARRLPDFIVLSYDERVLHPMLDRRYRRVPAPPVVDLVRPMRAPPALLYRRVDAEGGARR